MAALTGLDLEAITDLEEKLTELKGIKADVEIKITEFENDISGLRMDISTNSKNIADNIQGISANSAAISANTANISTNSENIDYFYNETDICINGINSQTKETCNKWVGGLKKLPLWGEKVSDDEIDFEWPTPEIWAQMQPDVSLQSMEFKTRHQDSYYLSSARVNLSNG